MSMTLDDMMRIVKPHNEKIIAEHRAEEAARSLELIVGHLGAAKVQRAPSDDTIIAEHIADAYTIALHALRRLRT